MKTKLQSMHILTGLSIPDLEYMFADELWDEQIRQDYLDGKFDKFIDCIQNQQEIPAEFHQILIDNFWELVSDKNV